MAKKKFNISSTLRKNKKEEIELAPKVPLKKKEKDMEEIKEKVEEIHAEKTQLSAPLKESVPRPQTPARTPKATTKKTVKPEPAVEIEKPKIVRMTIDTPEEMHLQLKIKSIKARMSMREYVLGLIERDLKKG